MKWIFWISIALIGYTYFGYPAWLYLRRGWRARPIARSEGHLPSISIVLAVHNEAAHLPGKLKNLAELDYPAGQFEIIVVSDGSTDETAALLASRAGDRLKFVALSGHSGKAVALNRGVELAQGEILVFTDARQRVEPGALRALVANFFDPAVGCVSGELMIGDPQADAAVTGVGLYWRMEKQIRQWESDAGSVVGATGAFYAARRELFVPLPEGTILDDVWTPMQVVRQGRRVIFESRAVAWDPLLPPAQQEFRRKVRTLTGNYQLLQLAPWLLTTKNPIRFEFLSHKLLRLLVPFALVTLLVSSWMLAGIGYQVVAIAQAFFYGFAFLALAGKRLGPVSRLANVAWTFIVLNTAAVFALFHFVAGKKQVWVR